MLRLSRIQLLAVLVLPLLPALAQGSGAAQAGQPAPSAVIGASHDRYVGINDYLEINGARFAVGPAKRPWIGKGKTILERWR